LLTAARRQAATDPDWLADYRRWRPPVERGVAWLVARGKCGSRLFCAPAVDCLVAGGEQRRLDRPVLPRLAHPAHRQPLLEPVLTISGLVDVTTVEGIASEGAPSGEKDA
jgi:hypothetical protein